MKTSTTYKPSYKAGAYLHYKMCSRKLGNVLLLDTAPLHMYVCSLVPYSMYVVLSTRMQTWPSVIARPVF